jgi:[ribosomal protein S5]-alanine N-acetyltransferase
MARLLARIGKRSKIALMALLDWIAPDHDLRLEGHGVHLRPLRTSDYSEWASLRSGSRHFLQPWEPTWPPDDLSRTAFRRRLTAYAQDIERAVAYPFMVFSHADGAMVGGVTVSNVRRGVAQMASLGYWIGEPFVRRGYTTAAVSLVTRFCFQRLGLHRVEAACIPTNEASRGVLLKCGFKQEGLARSYLRINGVWRDHLLFGLLTPTPAPDRRRPDTQG